MDSIGNSFVELFDFDNATGVVSNGISLPHDHLVYGLEFSPSSQYLYTVDHNNSASIIYKQVSQFDVTLGNAAAINASKVIVGIIWNSTTFFNGAAQLGPDGKIYIVPTDKDSLCVINDPNNAGLTCNLVVPGLYIQNQNDHGLPNRVVAVTNPCTPNALFFGNNHICPGTCTSFNNLSTGSTSYQWIFTGANPSTSTDVSPSNICYSNPGTYSVSLIAMNTSGSDTLTLNNFITVYPFPPAQGISQSGDTLFAIPGAVSYQWYFNGDTIAGATDYFYLALEGGDYNVVATDANDCEVEAAIFDVVAEIQLAIGNWQLAIYPNPVVDNLRIRCAPGNSNWLELKSISICNILGERVLAICLPTAYYPPIAIGMPIDLDCRLLPPGIYFLKVTSRNNETQTFKFSIQR
ncbi:MAG: T9SS type A sorting domain-containing protein, partial [Bacteroidota bacterium]